MSRPELEGFLRQADLLQRGQMLPPWLPAAPLAAPTPPQTGGHTQTFISKRRKHK